jgi:hypothetical protein
LKIQINERASDQVGNQCPQARIQQGATQNRKPGRMMSVPGSVNDFDRLAGRDSLNADTLNLNSSF